MEFTRKNIESLCDQAKNCVANAAVAIELIGTATGKPVVKKEIVVAIATGVLETIKPIACVIADATNGADLVPEMEKLVKQLEQLKNNPDLPTD